MDHPPRLVYKIEHMQSWNSKEENVPVERSKHLKAGQFLFLYWALPEILTLPRVCFQNAKHGLHVHFWSKPFQNIMPNVFSMGEIYHMLQKKRASMLLKFQLGPSPPSPLLSPPPLPTLPSSAPARATRRERRKKKRDPVALRFGRRWMEKGRFCLQA